MSTYVPAQDERAKTIVKTSIIGIAANIALALVKAIVGLAAHSIAVVLDAVNNLSDALSSVITIVGTKLASRKPDKKHPMGHGRIEYLSTMIVAAIILYAGITSGVESVKKIINPETPDYSTLALVLIALAVVVKVLLGTYVKKVGKKVNSGSLEASGQDALMDAIVSGSVLLSAVIFMVFHISLEAWVGLLIAGMIIKAGVEMMLEAVDELIGHRADAELSQNIRKIILEEPEVEGVYDLILNSYGPDKWLGSAHVSIPDTMTAVEIDALDRRIAANVFCKTGVAMTGIGVYAINTKNEEISAVQQKVYQIINDHEGVLQIHGFYLDDKTRQGNVDIVLDFTVTDGAAVQTHISEDLKKEIPDYDFHIVIDRDFTD
ncbi:MAG: cation transporter [Firmicutes bacterium]|nr:cation transporter [Bacillota bacterium]